jgi:hypothetical protein
MEEEVTLHSPEEETGTFSAAVRSTVAARRAALAFEGDATFEQILYFLLMGVKGGVSGSQQAATAAYLYAFEPSIKADPGQESYTLEFGDNVQAWEAEYCMASKLEISGAPNEAWRLRADIFGRQLTLTSFTADKNPPSVEPALFNLTQLYVDDTWAGIGGSELPGTLLGFTWTYDTGLSPLVAADGNIYFASHVIRKHRVELKMTLAFITGTNTERAKYLSQTLRNIRIAATGSEIESPYNNYIYLDTRGYYTSWSTLGERDGLDIVEVTVSSFGDVTNDDEAAVSVMAAVAAVP